MSGPSGATEAAARLRIDEYGDSGLLVTFLDAEPRARWAAARALAEGLAADRPEGLVDLVPSFDTLFVAFDPLVTEHAAIARAIGSREHAPVAPRPPRRHVVAVDFGGEAGPDLGSVAEELGISPARVIELCCEREWTVRVIGSPLGSPLLDREDLPARIPSVSRLREPRTRLPAGSLGVSGHQSVLYPFASPGGWRLIGRTTERLVELGAEPAVLLEPGDLVRYEPTGGAR